MKFQSTEATGRDEETKLNLPKITNSKEYKDTADTETERKEKTMTLSSRLSSGSTFYDDEGVTSHDDQIPRVSCSHCLCGL